jgi:hypothetical protein
MAQIAVVGTPFPRVLLNDLTKKQTLREQTIYPEGQERYITPVDAEGELTELLTELGGTAVAAELAGFIAATIGADDISEATVQTEADNLTGITGTTPGEAQQIIAQLAYPLIETGQFLLSFDRGVIAGLIDAGWVKVFTDAGNALFTL